VTWLAVDWISGFVHWFEDSYGRPSLLFVGDRITKPNLRHHFRPRAFVANSWYSSSELLLFNPGDHLSWRYPACTNQAWQ